MLPLKVPLGAMRAKSRQNGGGGKDKNGKVSTVCIDTKVPKAL